MAVSLELEENFITAKCSNPKPTDVGTGRRTNAQIWRPVTSRWAPGAAGVSVSSRDVIQALGRVITRLGFVCKRSERNRLDSGPYPELCLCPPPSNQGTGSSDKTSQECGAKGSNTKAFPAS